MALCHNNGNGLEKARDGFARGGRWAAFAELGAGVGGGLGVGLRRPGAVSAF